MKAQCRKRDQIDIMNTEFCIKLSFKLLSPPQSKYPSGTKTIMTYGIEIQNESKEEREPAFYTLFSSVIFSFGVSEV